MRQRLAARARDLSLDLFEVPATQPIANGLLACLNCGDQGFACAVEIPACRAEPLSGRVQRLQVPGRCCLGRPARFATTALAPLFNASVPASSARKDSSMVAVVSSTWRSPWAR